MALRSTILNFSDFVPAGTPESVIGGDFESKHFFVGPQLKFIDIAEAETGNATKTKASVRIRTDQTPKIELLPLTNLMKKFQ